MSLRAYLVDDEPLALERLRRLLENSGRVAVVGASCDPEQAVAEMSELSPELCFLDIEMPRLNGFEVLARLARQPVVIFVTAYDRYALRAFGVNSIDYLLKPVAPEALDKALDKAERLRGGAAPDLAAILRRLDEGMRRPGPQHPTRIASRTGERLRFLDLDQVTHFYAEDKLVYAVSQGRAHCVDHTLNELEQLLDPRRFVRIHRAAMVNLAWVQEASPLPGGSLSLRLRDPQGSCLTVARDRAREFKQRVVG